MVDDISQTTAICLKALAKRIVEETPDRPDYHYLLVDSELIRQLAVLTRTKIGRKARDGRTVMVINPLTSELAEARAIP
jgi:hypothetical protein